jgi:hypothetical protein
VRPLALPCGVVLHRSALKAYTWRDRCRRAATAGVRLEDGVEVQHARITTVRSIR